MEHLCDCPVTIVSCFAAFLNSCRQLPADSAHTLLLASVHVLFNDSVFIEVTVHLQACSFIQKTIGAVLRAPRRRAFFDSTMLLVRMPMMHLEL